MDPYEFNVVNILILGDLILDHYIFGEVARISPEAPVPIVKVEKEEYRLGGAANVAQNIKSLGGNAILVGLNSEDMAGQILELLLAEKCIENISSPVKQYKTSLKQRIIARGQQIVRVDWEQEKPEKKFSDVAIDCAIKELNKCNDFIDAVVISDYGKGTIGESLPKLIEVCNGMNKPVIIDPKPMNKELYRGCSIIVPNLKEAIEMTGDGTSLEICRRLLDIAHAVLVTEGKLGMSLLDPDGCFTHFPAKAKGVYDITGAGDTVVAVFALCYASEINLRESVNLSNIAAGIVVGKQGAATLTVEELFGGGTI